MKVTFCGTNGWYDTQTGNTTCVLIETKSYFIILDAGNGIYKIDRFIKSKKPIYLFISHFHIDHIVGFHILNKFNFLQGMRIYGQPGTKKFLHRLVNKPYTIPLDKLPFKVKIYELSEGLHRIPFSVRCRPLLHSDKCFGYRFAIDGKIIAYCPDTGICENVRYLAQKADLLIAECSFAFQQRNQDWPHLNPEDAARIANDAGAKKLFLMHFDASIYRDIKERRLAQRRAREIFKNTFASFDDMQIEV